MTDYGKIKSTVKPEPLEIDKYSAYINTDITEIAVELDGETYTEYEYNQVRYSKDEYIKAQAEQLAAQDVQIVDTQLALCDVYEMLGG